MKTVLLLIVATVLSVFGMAVWLMKQNGEQSEGGTAGKLPVEGRMPSLENVTLWLNSEPLSSSKLRGKVVLVNFWTYSCINWRRQAPYIRAWAEKYGDAGLVVLGVHTPEFDFEKDPSRVSWAVWDMSVRYPVAVDNDYRVWNDFGNRYWPALYLVDGEGNIRHRHFGEGDYEKSERAIQQLLREGGRTDVSPGLAEVSAEGAEADADWSNLHSPETYTGAARTTNFSSPGGLLRNVSRSYQFPSRLDLYEWALSGEWRFGEQATTLTGSVGGVRLRFHARDVHLVIGPSTSGVKIRFRILVDGKVPTGSTGVDVDEEGYGTIVESRMYQLLRQPKPITTREIEVTFLSPGVEIYAFTFG